MNERKKIYCIKIFVKKMDSMEGLAKDFESLVDYAKMLSSRMAVF